MPHTKAGNAFTELVLETFRFNGRLLLAGDRLAKPIGLTSSRWQVLGAIEEKPLSVAQIARKMGLARQNVQRLADALHEEAIVEYTPNPDHQRAKLVFLTDKGRRAMKKLDEIQAQWANRIASGTSASDIQRLLDLMKKLRSRLEADSIRQAGVDLPQQPRS
jgi:DNA-binding MarR family transcriptional regulator